MNFAKCHIRNRSGLSFLAEGRTVDLCSRIKVVCVVLAVLRSHKDVCSLAHVTSVFIPFLIVCCAISLQANLVAMEVHVTFVYDQLSV